MSETKTLFKLELTEQQIRNAIDAFDFIIGHGYDEGNGLIAMRQEMAALINAPRLLLCDYCGNDKEDDEFKDGDNCPKCKTGRLRVAVEQKDEQDDGK